MLRKISASTSFAALVLVLASYAHGAPQPQLDGTGWWLFNQNNWSFNADLSDEFNQPGDVGVPNPNKWNRSHPTGWTGNNSFTYKGEWAYTHRGNLVLEARNGAYVGDKHTCGIVSSVSRNLKYGYFEVRAKAADNNIASNFWFFERNPSNGHQFEIDVYEHFPYRPWNSHRKMKSNIHHFVWAPDTGNVDQIPYYQSPVDLPNNRVVTDWNVYGVLRTDGGLYFYVNGTNVRTIWKSQVPAASWPGDKTMPMILDILVYDWQQGDNEPLQKRSFYYVDYFRAWN